MALHAGSRRLPYPLHPRTFLSLGGALAVGFVAFKCNWRSNGNFRSESTLRCASRLLRIRPISTLNIPFSWPSAISFDIQMSLVPPQAPPSWNHSAEDITRLTNEFIARDRAVEDKVGALAPKDCNFQSASISDLLQCSMLIITTLRYL
jgi:hypothetical protein